MNLIYFSQNPKEQLILPDQDLLVEICKDREDVTKYISNGADLLIIDFNTSKEEVIKLCKLIRKDGWNLPVIIISETKDAATKISLLDSGADDYLEKPYNQEELIARIKALSRRPKYFQKRNNEKEELIIDSNKQAVLLNSKFILLTKKEFLILEYFINHPNKLLTRSDILEHAWGLNANAFSKSIEMHILNLRKKIDPEKIRNFIKTVSGRGYIFTKGRNK
jgi:DNA-binding response OmpR family regulator